MIIFFARKGLNVIAIKDASHTNSEYTLKRLLFRNENKEICSAFSLKKVYKQLFCVLGILKVLFYPRSSLGIIRAKA